MKEAFLQLVANDLYNRFGNNMSSVALIFPNKRAHLFFNEFLASCSSAPIWTPSYLTINELFHMQSPLRIVDPVLAVCELYRSYCRYTEKPETLDYFYGWGERMLNDFDDIDRQMADAETLFRNIEAIKELEMKDSLDEEKEAVLAHFFKDFSKEKNSRIKQRFLDMWEKMLPIYNDFNERLAQQGLAYEGALNRRVLEALQRGEDTHEASHFSHYAFVGFNVLTKSEEGLFAYYQAQGRALFYWDYDIFYLNGPQTEAGIFLKNNLQRFPNALPDEAFHNFGQDKEVQFVAASTARAQAHFAGQWLQTHLTEPENRTAVVLCDENLLQPVLHSLPKNVRSLNVTNGFPMYQTTAYTRIEQFLDQETGGSAANKDGSDTQKELDLLGRLAEQIKEEAVDNRRTYESIGQPSTDEQRAYQLQSESLFQAYTLLNRFQRYITDNVLTVNLQTLLRLIRQTLGRTVIPYHGEPLTGLQIMGLLETRCLDFEHVLFLSANEGILPNAASNNSFIPYFLRKAYGLTTNEHRVAIMAYYFYRLLQRCSHCTLVYSDTSTGTSKGEMSRFMTQLLVETDLPIRRLALNSEARQEPRQDMEIAKTADMFDKLDHLSPTALNTYLTCQLRFYFQHIAKLKTPEPPRDVIEPDTFGSLFHKAAELVYTELTLKNGAITRTALEEMTKDKGAQLVRFVRNAFTEENVAPQLVIEEVLRLYLTQLLENDKKLAPFEIVEIEQWHETQLAFESSGKKREISVGGFIDRMDLVEIDDGKGGSVTTLRIVDYKTGGQPEAAKNMQELTEAKDDRPHYIFQTFIYALSLCGKTQWPIAPALFFVHKSAGDDYNPYIRFGEKKEAREVFDFQTLAGDFKEVLIKLLEDIFDTSIPFRANGSERMCRNCPFNTLCGKQ